MEYENPKLKQSEIANQLGYSTSTLQRYRNDINRLQSYRIQTNNNNKRTKTISNTNSNNDLLCNPGVKRTEMTSNDLMRHQSTSNANGKKVKTENKLKTGFVNDNVGINDQNLDVILD